MKAEWMGRYRELVAALVQHSNTVARTASEFSEISEGVFLTPVAWQVLEYLIEHEDEPSCMSRISGALGIPQSVSSLAFNFGVTYCFRPLDLFGKKK